MKKILLFCFMLLLSVFLVTCVDKKSYDEKLKQIETTIVEQIPSLINADFKIDIDQAYHVTYTLFDQVNTGHFQYVSPFYDKKGVIKISIKRGISQLDIEKEVMLLALDSGLNETKIYLSLEKDLSEVNKDDYMQTSVKVETKINGQKTIQHETNEAKLRGRGNSTWHVYEKKPYRLRFDKNTSILGMKAAKSYVLLAEYADKSLIRNAITHKMSTFFSHLSYTLPVRFVELYINEQYLGVYLLTEQVENHPNKLNLQSEAGILNTNYLFELDMRFFEQNEKTGYDWFIVDRHAYQIKAPDTNELAYRGAHTTYLKDQLEALESSLIARREYQENLDVQNAIDFFLIHEITKNVDVGWSSVFMIKEKNGPFYYGPLWDFDFAYGNAYYIDYGVENWYGMREEKNRMFMLLMRIPDIRESFKHRFNWFYTEVLPEMIHMIDVLSSSLTEMAKRNFERWPIMETKFWPTPDDVLALHTFEDQVSYVKNYLIQRSDWMRDEMVKPHYAYGLFD